MSKLDKKHSWIFLFKEHKNVILCEYRWYCRLCTIFFTDVIIERGGTQGIILIFHSTSTYTALCQKYNHINRSYQYISVSSNLVNSFSLVT